MRNARVDSDVPVVIAVGKDHFADWIKFAGGMSVKLRCDRDALDIWWQRISAGEPQPDMESHATACEIFK